FKLFLLFNLLAPAFAQTTGAERLIVRNINAQSVALFTSRKSVPVQILVSPQRQYNFFKKTVYFVHHSSSRLYLPASISGLGGNREYLFCSFLTQFLIAARQSFIGVLPT